MKQTLLTLLVLLFTPALAQLQTTGETTRQAAGLTLSTEAQVMEALSCNEYAIRMFISNSPEMNADTSPQDVEVIVQEYLAEAENNIQQGKSQVFCLLFPADLEADLAVPSRQLEASGYTRGNTQSVGAYAVIENWISAFDEKIHIFYDKGYAEGLLVIIEKRREG